MKTKQLALFSFDVCWHIFGLYIVPFFWKLTPKPKNSRFLIRFPARAIKGDYYNLIPNNQKPRIGKLYVQRHQASHDHFDISIVDSGERELFRGAVSKRDISKIFPTKSPTAFARQPQHRSGRFGYDWSGEIKNGYGKGIQTLLVEEPIEIMRTNSDKISFNIYSNEMFGEYSLIRGNSPKQGPGLWMCVRRILKEPAIKGKNDYSLVSNQREDGRMPDITKMEKKIAGRPISIEIKADGGANLMEFGEKENHIWSWRDGKKSPTIWLHHKFPEIRDDVHQDLQGTIVRGELVYSKYGTGELPIYRAIGKEHPGLVARFSIIKNPLESRIEQAKIGGNAGFIIYDIERYNNKSIPELSYNDKYRLAVDIAKKSKYIYVPKRYNSIKEGWSDVTKNNAEGLIIKLLDEPSPKNGVGENWFKMKQQDFFDARIVGWKPLIRKNGEVDNTRVGKLVCKMPKGEVGVGTGLTDFERLWYAKNIKKILSDRSIIKIKGQRESSNGSIFAPVYKGPHLDKSNGVLTELAL